MEPVKLISDEDRSRMKQNKGELLTLKEITIYLDGTNHETKFYISNSGEKYQISRLDLEKIFLNAKYNMIAKNNAITLISMKGGLLSI